MDFERGKDVKSSLDIGLIKRSVRVRAIDVVYYPPDEWTQDIYNFRVSKHPDKILHERSTSVLYRFKEDMEETDELVPLLAGDYMAAFEEGLRKFCSEFYSREYTWQLGKIPKPEATNENSRIATISLIYTVGNEEELKTINLPVHPSRYPGHFPYHASGYYHKGTYYPFPQKPMP